MLDRSRKFRGGIQRRAIPGERKSTLAQPHRTAESGREGIAQTARALCGVEFAVFGVPHIPCPIGSNRHIPISLHISRNSLTNSGHDLLLVFESQALHTLGNLSVYLSSFLSAGALCLVNFRQQLRQEGRNIRANTQSWMIRCQNLGLSIDLDDGALGPQGVIVRRHFAQRAA